MNTIHQLIMTVALALIFINSTEAQGWTQNGKAIHSAGAGMAQSVFIPLNDYEDYGHNSRGVSFNIAGEYKIFRVVGIGWQTGINIFSKGYYYDKDDNYSYTVSTISIPIAFKMNLHILDAVRVRVSDQLDVYVGFNVGGGPSFHGDPYGGVYPSYFIGPQAGVRYWISKHIALFGDFGWGATIFNIGVTF